MSAAYKCLIEDVLEAGIRIDALGLQSHGQPPTHPAPTRPS
ncbi:hypothetical protein [Streptosporangium sp. 'caverna']|nr:hypothetical protein [Streptosporangium sp. 'caverna']